MENVQQPSTQFPAKIATMDPPDQSTYTQGQGLDLKLPSPTHGIQVLGPFERQGLDLSSGALSHSQALTLENRPANSHSMTTSAMDLGELAGTPQQKTTPLKSYHDFRMMISNLRVKISATIRSVVDRNRDYMKRVNLNSHTVQTTIKRIPDHQAPPAPGLIGDINGSRTVIRPPDSPDRDLQLPLFQHAHPAFQGDSSQRSTTTKPYSDHQAPSAPGLISDMDGPRSVSLPPDSPDLDRQLPLFQEANPGFQGVANQRSTTAKRLSDGQTLSAPGRIGDMNGPRSVSRPLGSPDRDSDSPFLEATQQSLQAPTEQRSACVRHTLLRATHDAAHPTDATKDMHEDPKPYKPDWEYLGFTKDGQPPLPDSDTATTPSKTPPATPKELESDTQQDSLSPPPLSRLPSRVLSVMKRLEHMMTTDSAHQSPESKECDTQFFDTSGDIGSVARLQPEAKSEDMDRDSYSYHDIDSDYPDPNGHWYDSSDEEAPPEQEPYNCYTSDEESNICITCPAEDQHHSSHQPCPMTIHRPPPATHTKHAIDEPIPNGHPYPRCGQPNLHSTPINVNGHAIQTLRRGVEQYFAPTIYCRVFHGSLSTMTKT